MPGRFLWLLAAWCSASVALTLLPETAQQGEKTRGAKVTFERVLPADQPRQVHSRRARLVSLAVERGEVPSAFLDPGYFKATYRAIVTLPLRDRYRFRIDGRGAAKLSLNGKPVLEGSLRGGKPIETDKSVRLKKGENELLLEFESTAMGSGWFRLLWAPPDCGFEPIPPELLSWASEDVDIAAGEQLLRGQRLFAERRCARCHEFDSARATESALGELDEKGPDLRSVGSRLRRDWMRAWLLDPHSFRHDTTMPTFGLSDKEAADVASYLAGLGEPMALEFESGAVEEGKTRFFELGCIACHVPPDRPREEMELGNRLPLHHVRNKWRPAALVEFLQDPSEYHRGARMPNFGLSRKDATVLAAYVAAGDDAPLSRVEGDVGRGRRLVQQKHCAVCHDLDVPVGERIAPGLRNLDPRHGCLAEQPSARGKAPDHHLLAEDRDALRAFLPFVETAPFRHAPIDYARRQFAALRCTNCHGMDNVPSVWSQVVNELSLDDPLPPEQDPVAEGVPSLTWVGAKLQPSWIGKFITGDEPSPRPWMHARMPAFAHRGEAITEGMVRQHGYGSEDEPPVAANVQMAILGEGLLQMGTGFGCVQCHALGDRPPEQVFERQGIELFLARRRLRHEYYSRWLLDPPRIDPESRMPRYANDEGKTAFTEVLDGDAVKQFEAIWQFLASRR